MLSDTIIVAIVAAIPALLGLIFGRHVAKRIDTIHILVNSQKDALISLVQTSLLEIAQQKAESLLLKSEINDLKEYIKKTAT